MKKTRWWAGGRGAPGGGQEDLSPPRSCGRSSVSARRASWLESRNWECIVGGEAWAWARKADAITEAEGEGARAVVYVRRRKDISDYARLSLPGIAYDHCSKRESFCWTFFMKGHVVV